MTNWENERVAVMTKNREMKKPADAPQDTNQSNETDKIAFVAGPSYDFWDSEGDSIYDKLYGDDC